MASDALQRAQLAATLGDFVAALATPMVHLFKDSIIITPETDLTTLTEPTGSWYTAQALTYGEVYEDPSGNMQVRTVSVQFNYSGTDPAETITGWFVMDSTGNVPISGGNLPAPVSLGTTLDSVIVQPSLALKAVPQS